MIISLLTASNSKSIIISKHSKYVSIQLGYENTQSTPFQHSAVSDFLIVSRLILIKTQFVFAGQIISPTYPFTFNIACLSIFSGPRLFVLKYGLSLGGIVRGLLAGVCDSVGAYALQLVSIDL